MRPRRIPSARRRVGGFTLIEILVAMTIGLFVIGAVIAVMLNSKTTYRTQQNISDLQETARFSLNVLSEDIRLAGYWGLNYAPASIDTTGDSFSISSACQTGAWINTLSDALFGLNNTNSGYSDCVPNVDYQSNTDVLVIRHAMPETVSAADIEKNGIYLHTSLTEGYLFQANAAGALDSGASANVSEVPVENYQLATSVYFVRPWSVVASDGKPTLVQLTLDGNAIGSAIIVENIEDFQVQYGLDNDGDGSVDTYQNANQVSAWSSVRTVKVELLVRSATSDGAYTNNKSYTLGDKSAYTPNDHYRRQVFSRTIFVRNSWRA